MSASPNSPESAPTNDMVVFASVGGGSVFQVTVHHWPEGRSIQDTEAVFGSYWPPMGVTVVSKPEGVVDREFVVDLAAEDSLVRFESDFGLYVSEKLPGFVPVHAALIHVDDAVAIIPGSSGVGKSSLCVAAMDAGWEVWSDEYCLIDTTTGDVSGWPRPIRQRLEGGGVKRISHQGPTGPGSATYVLTLKYSAATDTLDLEPISPGQVAMDLMANTVCAQSRPEETFRATTALAKTVLGATGQRGEAADALTALRSFLAN